MNLGNFVCRAEEIYWVTSTRSKIKQYELALNIQLCGKKNIQTALLMLWS